MLPHTHFLFPLFIGLILYKLKYFSLELVIIAALAGVFVDADHYIENIIHNKKNPFSLIATWNHSTRYHKISYRSFIHEKKGAILITVILVIISFFHQKLAIALALGYYSHLLLDYILLKRSESIRFKLGKISFKELYPEIILDILLILGIVIIFIT